MQGTSLAYFVFAIAILAFVVGPILAISAFVRVRRLEDRQQPDQRAAEQLNRQSEQQVERQLANLTARLYAIETRPPHLAARSGESPAAPAAPSPISPPAIPSATPPLE